MKGKKCHLVFLLLVTTHYQHYFNTYHLRVVNSELERADRQMFLEECRTSVEECEHPNITDAMLSLLGCRQSRAPGRNKQKMCIVLGYLDLGNCTPLQVSCTAFGKSFILSLLWFPTHKMEKNPKKPKNRPFLCQQGKTRTCTLRRGQKNIISAVPSRQSLTWCIEMSCAEIWIPLNHPKRGTQTRYLAHQHGIQQE